MRLHMLKVKTAAGILSIIVFATISLFAINFADPNFVPVAAKAEITFPDVKGQVILPDGKILVWGGALAADGLAKGQLVRLNADGTVDPTFTYCGCDFIKFVNAVPGLDGKVFVAGV